MPFETDIAHQRKRYGESLLRRTAEIHDSQQTYESTESGKIERARQEREAERQKHAEHEVRRSPTFCLGLWFSLNHHPSLAFASARNGGSE